MLTEPQKKYVIQNFTHTDEQLASFLKVDVEEVTKFTKELSDVMSSIKEMAKTSTYPTIIIDLISEIDIMLLVNLPKFTNSFEKDRSIKSIKNLIKASEEGQLTNIILEGLRRNRDMGEDYAEVYNEMDKFVRATRDDCDVVSPLHTGG